MESNVGRENAVDLGMLNWWQDNGRPTEKPLAARILGTDADYVTNLILAQPDTTYVRVYVDGDRIKFNYWEKPAGPASSFPYGVPVEDWS